MDDQVALVDVLVLLCCNKTTGKKGRAIGGEKFFKKSVSLMITDYCLLLEADREIHDADLLITHRN
jgi:hypothetical protein